MLALLRELRAKTRADFESPGFPGQQFFLAFVREYGADVEQPFAALRLPDEYYALKAEQTEDAINRGDATSLDVRSDLLPGTRQPLAICPDASQTATRS